MLKLVLLFSKGLIRSQQTRRQLMFYTTLAAMLMLFPGSTIFQEPLRQNPLLLLLYWAACGWLTILSALLALFDILLLRVAARAARRVLEQEYLRAEQERRER